MQSSLHRAPPSQAGASHPLLQQARHQVRPCAFSSCPSPRPCPSGRTAMPSSSGRSAGSVTARAKLGTTSLFGDSASSSLLGGAAEPAPATSKPRLEDVPLESEAGMDYSSLRDHLASGEYQRADDDTRALIIKLAGEGAVKRGWVYFSEVKTMPAKDLQTIDALWKLASDGKFGFSVQREIFNQTQRRWPKFFKQIDWVVGENNIYRKWPMEFTYTKDAPRGHLPLTNALRGTQLLQALLEHPAFEKTTTNKRSIDDITKEQTQSASKLFY